MYCVEKSFSQEDKLKYEREKSFYLHANKCDAQVPSIICYSDTELMISLDKVKGSPCAKVTANFLQQLTNFINVLNSCDNIHINKLAAEALIDPIDLKNHLMGRFRNLRVGCKHAFFRNNSYRIRNFLSKRVPLIKSSPKIINPSDIGLHNTIMFDDKIIFIDFEYAGFDTYTKLYYDFILHPANNINPKNYTKILNVFKRNIIDFEVDFSVQMLDGFRIWWVLRLLDNITEEQIEKRLRSGAITQSNVDLFVKDRIKKINGFWEDISID